MAAPYRKRIEEIESRGNVDREKSVKLFLAETKTARLGAVKSLAAVTKETSQAERGIAMPVPALKLLYLQQNQLGATRWQAV